MTPTLTPTLITPCLAEVPTDVDVVVIGLGVTGAGVALDAVTRGLSVLAAQVNAQLDTLGDDGRTADTLRAYLYHRGTLSELAATQDIHVNTLRYRLRRAEEVLGGRLSDPALLARLYLAFRTETV